MNTALPTHNHMNYQCDVQELWHAQTHHFSNVYLNLNREPHNMFLFSCNFPLGLACEKRHPQVQVNLPETQVLKGESRTCGGSFSQTNLSGQLALFSFGMYT